MRITLLKKNPKIYSSNAYLARGNWNAIDDVNTLIDVGTDGYLLDELQTISTGVGKRRVEQVILTHEHFDHTGGLKHVIARYRPKVYAYSKIKGVDEVLRDGKILKVGDSYCQILHTPGHSHDSICVFCPDDGILFSGDTSLNIKTPGGAYGAEYVRALERLSELNIRAIYSGHDAPMTENVMDMIKNTLENVKKSKIQ